MEKQNFTNEPIFITQAHLAKRWGIAKHTLEKWRWEKRGPRYIKIGRVVRYNLADIEAYEASHSFTCMTRPILVGGEA